MLLLGCTTFMFAGSYPSSLTIPALICAVLVVAYRPWQELRAAPALHGCLAGIVGLMALQLVPLPAPLVDRLSPTDRPVWQSVSLVPVLGPLPLSVDLAAGFSALMTGGAVMIVFIISRVVFGGGGVRIAARGVAGIGLALAALCLAQDATGHGRMYWRWYPGEGPPPFGPFLNRNHFATWAVLAIPIALGYLMAHASAHKRSPVLREGWHRRLLHFLDPRSIWLAASISLMLVALVVSLSRSGAVGLLTAVVVATYLRARRTRSPVGFWMIAALGLGLAGAAWRIDAADLWQRFGSAATASASRVAIWRATMPIVRDFWLTGAGAGAFETVMLVYQRTPSLFRINAAHNHYLQVAAEGGLLIGLPVAAAIVLFVREARVALAADQSGMYFLRVGALSGLAGVAVQSVWETGLTTPANGLLAAIAAAIVLHRSLPRLRHAD